MKSNTRLSGQILTLTWITLILFSCAGNKDTESGRLNNALNKDKDALASDSTIRENDVLWYKDVHVPDYGYSRDPGYRDQPVPEALYFMPKDAEEGAKCVKWEKIHLDQNIPGWKDLCWGPPEHWCFVDSGSITYACSPDNRLCCYFDSYCTPCGWTKYPDTSAKEDKPETSPEKCRELKMLTHFYDWMVCREWQ